MDFSNSGDGSGSATGLFLDEVGEIVAEHRKDVHHLWAAACRDTWGAALRGFKPSRPTACNHRQELHDRPTSIRNRFRQADDQLSNENVTQHSSRSGSDLLDIPSRYAENASEAQSGVTKRVSLSNETVTQKSSERSSEIFHFPECYNDSASKASSGMTKRLSGHQGSFRSVPSDDTRDARSQPSSHCSQCAGDNLNAFPFVSDVAPLAILMILEAVQNHKELSFRPMTPAYTPERPEYLSNGLSFRVTHVPWKQVRADTEGRVVSDAVYKRLNHNAPKKAWLDFMKDLIVTHHMTYHVSDYHKRNVVKLIGVGWERVIDDVLGEPTLAPVIALEYAPYGTLQDVFYSSAFLSSYRRKLSLLTDICEGLRALHFSNVVHGDVKPANILVYKDRDHGIIAKLSDFGLAVIDPESGPEFQSLPGGREPYLAPEAHTLISRDFLKFADVYSFGVVAWQTLLGGAMPFFSPRFRDGQSLSDTEVRKLKTGKDPELASLYGIQVDSDEFSRLIRSEELRENSYEPPCDPVNTLLVAMASDSLSQMSESISPDGESLGIPSSELSTILSVLQISLSTCPVHRRLESILVLLGTPYEDCEILISEIKWEAKVQVALHKNLRLQTVTARFRELYSSIFEQFFVTIQRNPNYGDLDALGHWDAVLTRYLGSSLIEHYIWKFLSGDRSEKTRDSLLSCLALCSSAGDLGACSAGLSIHQLLRADMKWRSLYTTGTALALLKGDNTLFWNGQQPAYSVFQAQLTKGLIRRFQDEQINEEQNRAAAHVLLGLEVGPFDVNVQNNQGDTLLNLACQSANFPLVYELIENHDASASVANNYGEEPIHWLHQIPAEKPKIVEAIAVLLNRAGADVECYAPPRMGEYCLSFSNHYLFPTPLLRAVARRNVSAVSCLVRLGAQVSGAKGSIYAEIKMSPLSLASSMLEHECLEVMLPYWSPESHASDLDNTEAHGLWEDAISGLSGTERVKIHGGQYVMRVKRTLEVLTTYLGPCYLVRNTRSSLQYAVDGGDLVWVEALLENLYSDPKKAVLADLQKGLECAAAQGYRHIVTKLMEYGALPLLPHKWSLSVYTAGRPGKWNEDLIDCLTKETFKAGHICAETKCSLHFCANGGGDAVTIAEELLQHPVVNECLMPSLPDANDNGLSHFVTAAIEGRYPGLDRPDEDHRTPLYNAVANGEFSLARCFLDRRASYKVDQWSLLAQIFEDGRTSLPNQIEFLLSNRHQNPAFNLTRRVFGRLQPQSARGLQREIDFKNWTLEEHTIITAMAEVCRAFDDFSKKICWGKVLSIFNEVPQILARAENGKDALEIAIDSADHVTLNILVNKMDKKVFEEYTVVDQIRDLLLTEPLARIADSVIKKRIISYRWDLGDMIETMLAAGDKGKSERNDLCERILEIITNEFPILVIGFLQRGDGHESIRQFKRDSEKLCNAFMTTLYCCHTREYWLELLEALDDGFRKLLSPHFDVWIDHWEYPASRRAKVVLTTKRTPPFPRLVTRKGKQPERNLTQNSPMLNESQVEPLLDWDLYRKIVVTEIRAGVPGSLPLPRFLHVPTQFLTLRNLGFMRGTTLYTPGTGFFTATMLQKSYPNRDFRPAARGDKLDPAYYFKPPPSEGPAALAAHFEAQENKEAYVRNVVHHFNPSAESMPQREMRKDFRDRLLAHVDSLVDTRALTTIDPESIHPLFGRVRHRDGYMDLPIDIIIKASRRQEQELLRQYEGSAQELPDELQRILNTRGASSDEDESSEDE